MKLSRLFLSLLVCSSMLFGGCLFDDEGLWCKLNDIESRLQKIETLNGGIESLWTIVNTLNGYDHISDVKNNTDGSYTITFASGKTVTIRDGAKGDKGDEGAAGKDAPVIGVKQHTDGVYYWTTGTDWLLDANDAKIRVTGEQGDEGAPGVTPLMDIDDAGYWTVSYDGGKTYTRLLSGGAAVKAAGDKGDHGDSFFSSVSKDDDFLYLTLAGNDTVLQLPIMHGLTLVVTGFREPQTFMPGVAQTFEVVAPEGMVAYVISRPDGWKASVAGGILTVTPPAEDADGDLAGVVVLEGYSESLNASTKRMLAVRVFTGDVYDYITDPAFLAYVKAQDWDGGDGKLTPEEAAAVTKIVVRKGYEGTKISSLAGIEYFTGLTYLDCGENQLTLLDVKANTALTMLYCNDNQLTSLDVSQNTALTTLNCGDNELTSLDVSKNTALTGLYCSDNQLTSLDVSKNTALTGLFCHNNNLTSLDISKNTALTMLFCNNNQLTSLDLSRNTALTELWCGNNQLTLLDISKNTMLTRQSCSYNQLTSLDVSQNTALKWLYCHRNRLTSLDASGMADPTGYSLSCGNQTSDGTAPQTLSLTLRGEQMAQWTDKLASEDENTGVVLDADVYAMIPDAAFLAYVKAWTYCDTDQDGKLSPEEAAAVKRIRVSDGYNGTKISSLAGIEYFTGLTELYCGGNQLTSLDISRNTALTELWCSYNELTSLDVSKNTALTVLGCSDNQLTSLDVSKNTALTMLSCSENPLTSIDVSKNTALTVLYCYDNQLTSLDVKANTELTTLNCGDNELTSLDISKNTALTGLLCNSNPLTSLDLSKNTELTVLWCGSYSLTGLDMSHNTKLTELDCSYSKLTSLDVSKNTALTRLSCSNNRLTSLDVSKNTALTRLSCNDNQLTSLDISKNTALNELYCCRNRLTSLDASGMADPTDYYLTCGQQTSDGVKAQELTLTLRGEQMALWKDKLASEDLNTGVKLAE